MTPEELVSTGWVAAVGGAIVRGAGGVGTCPTPASDRTIDFFVIPQSMALAVHSCSVEMEAVLRPHRPVQLLLAGNP
eukprot:3565381-Alexandrium_andersonii.AAC.1